MTRSGRGSMWMSEMSFRTDSRMMLLTTLTSAVSSRLRFGEVLHVVARAVVAVDEPDQRVFGRDRRADFAPRDEPDVVEREHVPGVFHGEHDRAAV